MAVRPAKTQISLGIRPVWSESSLSAWRKVGTLATHWTHSEGSEMSEIEPIWDFQCYRNKLVVILNHFPGDKTVFYGLYLTLVFVGSDYRICPPLKSFFLTLTLTLTLTS